MEHTQFLYYIFCKAKKNLFKKLNLLLKKRSNIYNIIYEKIILICCKIKE